MAAFQKLAVVQGKLYLREPMAAFFTLFFGPLVLVLLGLVIGNRPDPMFGGKGYLDLAVPAYIGVVIGIVGLTVVPITSVIRRETGVLRRFSMTPLRPLTYFATDILVPFVITLGGVLLLVLLGRFLYDVRLEGNPAGLLAAVALGTIAFFALGYALAALMPNSRVAILVGNVVLYPMLFLSGAFMPLQMMPAQAQALSQWLPMTHLVALLRGAWYGAPWSGLWVDAAVLAGVAALGVAIVALTFRWE
jgi:ABC-2 type transport system permease protein